ncbi:DUF1294 domain-containing protein [Wukongibacter sp. M2B1]|uniref:DUF1294 domain-containing protein n=1 Tax=Wukongibacter sp. M2B1 TaxID=3088895 RepID=UPI003D7C13EF
MNEKKILIYSKKCWLLNPEGEILTVLYITNAEGDVKMQLLKHKEFYFILYILIINLFGFSIMLIDKYKAKKNKWRIKEQNFFITAAIGGAIGVLLGMTMVRHKTQHKSFYIGIPMLYLLNKIIICILIYFIYLPRG